MQQGTLVDSALQCGRSFTWWRERLPTMVGLAIIVGFVTYNLVFALFGPTDWMLLGIRIHRLYGGGYWIGSQSLGRLMRVIIISAGTNWILASVVVLIVTFWEKRPLTSIGLRMPRAGELLPSFAALVAFYLIAYTGNLLGSLPNPRAFFALYALPWMLRLWLLSIVVCEEIMFRGYFIERVEELTGSMWVAAISSSILFGLNHASGWGLGYVFVVAAEGADYATLYIWRRNLPVCMVVHFITDTPLL
jgi:membrane protease YdiL (CAAX protease family)